MAEISSQSSSSGAQVREVEMVDRKMSHSAVAEKPMDRAVEDNDPDFVGTKSTDEDKVHMHRLGKKQQLVVRSHRISLNYDSRMLTAMAEAFPVHIYCGVHCNVDRCLGDWYFPYQSRPYRRRARRIDLDDSLELHWVLSNLSQHVRNALYGAYCGWTVSLVSRRSFNLDS